MSPLDDHDAPPAPTPEAGPIDAAIMFVDLVSSSEFASVLTLREYAEYLDSFMELCDRQIGYYFDTVLRGKYRAGDDYLFQNVGDELAVFLYSGNPTNDVYLLTCLAITLKCAWLGTPLNRRRLKAGKPATELAVGINFGKVWRRPPAQPGANPRLSGYAIHVAKRTETASRDGESFRVFATDPAYNRVNRRMRNILFGKRRFVNMKGVVTPTRVYEVVECFVNPQRRLQPALGASFMEVAGTLLRERTLEPWIHSCWQVAQEAEHGHVTDEALELCQQCLNIDPRNAVALYYAAQATRERGDIELARSYLADLTRLWPDVADGWLEYGRLLEKFEDFDTARRAIIEARRRGVDTDEAS